MSDGSHVREDTVGAQSVGFFSCLSFLCDIWGTHTHTQVKKGLEEKQDPFRDTHKVRQ